MGHQVRVGLSLRIKRFMKIHYNSRKSRIHEEDINFFRNLPVNLKIELHQEIYMPVITAHPLFVLVSRLDYKSTLELCHLAMSQTYIIATQDVFVEDELATQMFFIVKGRLQYYPKKARCHASVPVAQSAWVAEPVLWTEWMHRGRLMATLASEVAALDPLKFQALTLERLKLVAALREYAGLFAERMSQGSELDGWCNDLCPEPEHLVHQLGDFQELQTETNRRSTHTRRDSLHNRILDFLS